MSENKYNLIVIGGGPGGYVAAIRASQLGMRVALVEKEQLGGVCLNWGCIPTKALLRSAEIHHLLKAASVFGLRVSDMGVDWSAVVARSRQVAGQLSKGVAHLLKKNKVEIISGHGTFQSANSISVSRDGVESVTLSADHIIVATGARARDLPGIAAGSDRVWNYRQAMTATTLPSSLLVVGSGAIGIEFASLFAEFGVAVSVAEMADRILPNEDTEVSAYAKAQFEKRGIRFLTEAKVTSLEETATSVEAVIDTGTGASRESFDCALIAVGVVANSDSLALEKVGVELKNTSIVINEWGQTCVPSIWAIGDVAGGPWLAHKASHEAVATVEHIAGHPAAHPINRANIPGCTYSFPQIASIGLTEQQALAANCKIRKGNFPFMGNGKALALGDADGFIKTVVDDDTGEILGAHMVGAEVTELIHSFVLARELEATEDEVGMTMFPHPTLSEALHESVLSAAGKALHI